MSHTKEPWAQYPDAPNVIVAVADENVSLHTVNDDGMGAMFHEEDARRIVACVNACAGIEIDALEDSAAPGLIKRMVRDEMRRVTAQRDELLAALKRASESLGRFVSDEGWLQSDMDCMDNADAIIAKVEAANAQER